jgi:hypothetical protein
MTEQTAAPKINCWRSANNAVWIVKEGNIPTGATSATVDLLFFDKFVSQKIIELASREGGAPLILEVPDDCQNQPNTKLYQQAQVILLPHEQNN